MRDRCQIAAEMAAGGALHQLTVLLLLDDLEVSDIKETLASGANMRGNQHEW